MKEIILFLGGVCVALGLVAVYLIMRAKDDRDVHSYSVAQKVHLMFAVCSIIELGCIFAQMYLNS